MVQWNGKREAVWLILLCCFFPAIIAMIAAVIVPLTMHPILFWVLVISLFAAGFVIVWKRAGKKD